MTLLLLLFGVLLIVALCVVLIALGSVALHARRKKRAPHALTLMGRTGSVVAPLCPEGAVLVADELWRARAVAGGQIDGGRGRGIGARGHLVGVEAEGG